MLDPVTDRVLHVVAATLSLACSAACVATWCLMPRWRTLHNFISINQIVLANLHLISVTIYTVYYNELSKPLQYTVVLLNGYLFLMSICWSLCASMFAYLKLVLVYTGNFSSDKKKVVAAVYGTVIVVRLICDVIIANLYPRTVILTLRLLPVYLIVTVNLLVFVRVMKSVMGYGRPRVSPVNAKRIISLIGVALLCDSITTLYMLLVILPITFPILFNVIEFMFLFRLLPQTAVVLFNRVSREHWKRYCAQRKNRALNFA